jgi:hypothetical protein
LLATLVSGGGISTLQPEADPTYRLGRLGLDEELLLLDSQKIIFSGTQLRR